jgi:hypothetical protein
VIHERRLIAELDELQRKAHTARRALKTVQSEGRAALQLVAQLDDEIAQLRRIHTAEEAQTREPAHRDTPQAIHV